jgi:Fur family transcriptional regulator, ferric uptake regulator
MDKGRNRRTRQLLLDTASSMSHAFSAQQLHDAAKKRQPGLGLSTAYRTLERWRQDGTVEAAGSRNGEAVYLMCPLTAHHHHLVCTTCGTTSTLDGCALTSIRDAAHTVGFELNHDALASLPGRCARCATLD